MTKIILQKSTCQKIFIRKTLIVFTFNMQCLYTLRDGTIEWECSIAAFVYVILVERGNIVSSSEKFFDVFFKACLQTQSLISKGRAVHFHSIISHLLLLLEICFLLFTNNLRLGHFLG